MSTPATQFDASHESPPAGDYRIDPSGSTVSFTIRHLFGLGRASGTFALNSAAVTVEPSLSESHVTATADAASFTTGNAKRDEHVKSADFLDVEAHPELAFRSSSVRRDGDAWVLTGELTVKGHGEPLDLTIVGVQFDEAGMTVRATGKVDRYAFGVTKMKGMAGRSLTVDITARASRSIRPAA